MRLRMEKSGRFPGGGAPWLIAALAVCGYLLLHFVFEASFRLCWFRTLTGINCPTCGISRAFLALFQGQIGLAFRLNPLMLTFSLALIPWFGLTLLGKRRPVLEASPGERKLLWVLFLALFLLNWAWVAFFSPAA